MKRVNKVEAIVNKFESYLECFRLMDDKQLEEAFAEAVEMTSDGLTRMAAGVRAYDERGKQLPHMDASLLACLRQMSQGKMTVEAYMGLGNRPSVLKEVAELPPEEQIGLMKKGYVEVVVPTRNGVTTERVKLGDLSRKHLKTVFGKGRIRSPREQAKIVKAKTDPSNTKDMEFVTVLMSVADKMVFEANAASLRMSNTEYAYSLIKQGGGFTKPAIAQ